MKLPYGSGVQLHITSLPSGRLGDDARAFVDWLAAAGQSVWQVLPVTVPDRYGSPYKSPSAFAASAALLEDPDAPVSEDELIGFREAEAYWVDSWVEHGGDLADQVRFQREWEALREYASARGIALMGDVPVYVAPDSADERFWPDFFRSDAVAGVPPDAYTDEGQLWGNPLYRWDVLADDGFVWWVERLRRTFALFDVVRLDHFRGFVAFWAVPAGDDTAAGGAWEPGPGKPLFDAATAALGELPVLAEDLGDIDAPVIALRRALGYPGMAVLQFAFDPEESKPGTHDPVNQERAQVVYTGTHDNDTVCGWWATIPEARRQVARTAMLEAGVTADPDDEPSWAMIELALAARCELAMMQAQDVLSLGSEARMNVPGVQGGSWQWRMAPGALTDDLAARLRALTEAADRLPA